MPLSDARIAEYRALLCTELERLASEEAATSEDREAVTLDQQSVGRLSRMDAMQMQAMAQATQRRRSARRARIEAALRRMEEGEFGYCQDCGDDISPKRLDLDPTVLACVSCAGG